MLLFQWNDSLCVTGVKNNTRHIWNLFHIFNSIDISRFKTWILNTFCLFSPPSYSGMWQECISYYFYAWSPPKIFGFGICNSMVIQSRFKSNYRNSSISLNPLIIRTPIIICDNKFLIKSNKSNIVVFATFFLVNQR